MKEYRIINNLTGWLIFLIASLVYILTSEPTTSFWDCGEYIATAYKLQVGHPPGAPFFQLVGRFFSLFAFGDTGDVARMINIMSALSSSFTILFLYWTITMLAEKLIPEGTKLSGKNMFVVIGSGIIGSLAYTFTDSFWFSAVEGEVYAMSSFFTALVFWAILKWEKEASERFSFRWIILIAYLVGLSIGVHLLNLLAIPAITLVYYYRKTENPTIRGAAVATGVSFIILVFLMYFIIPWIVRLSGMFELFFVNTLRLPFNSGTIFYFVLLIGLIIYGLRYSRQRSRPVLNTIILSFTFILLGYSSFFMLIIRSNANTPIDENNPENAISLLAYLNREQYGDWPVFYGQYYNAPVIDREDGNPVYRKDVQSDRYKIINARKGTVPVFDQRFMTIFPRMWSNTEQRYIDDYKYWAKVQGEPVRVDSYGEQETVYKPTFRENLRFFFRYQLGHMYLRYFMWNFAGRQNDVQGMKERLNGNWISGIPFIDKWRLGIQDTLPDHMQNHKARNTYYLLPLLAGLLGAFFHLRRDKRYFYVVFLLFFMTGIAIVIYLNQYSPQPRERDYAYAASFYAFSIWIGLAVIAITNWLAKKVKSNYLPVGITVVLFFAVPFILAVENWDDHDRSGRYTALAMAKNYLNSCAPNAILFTNGDNDTFPLWYAQEVEGIRTDVRVVNLSLLNTEWYIDQLLRRAYDSPPVNFTLSEEKYRDGQHTFTYFIPNERLKGHVELSEIFRILKSDSKKLKYRTGMGEVDYFPTRDFKITVDSAAVMKNNAIPAEDADRIVDEIKWSVAGSGIGKNHLMVLDLIAHNNWNRPVYFAITMGKSSYLGLEDYFQLEGMAYRFVPVKNTGDSYFEGRVVSEIMYQNLMEDYVFTSMNKPEIYQDETCRRMMMNLRNNFYRLGDQLVVENKRDSAMEVLDRCMENIPHESLPYDYFVLPIAETYYQIGADSSAAGIMNRLIDVYSGELKYYFSLKPNRAKGAEQQMQQSIALLQRVERVTRNNRDTAVANRAADIFDRYYELYIKRGGF